jgi:hypothetical protein
MLFLDSKQRVSHSEGLIIVTYIDNHYRMLRTIYAKISVCILQLIVQKIVKICSQTSCFQHVGRTLSVITCIVHKCQLCIINKCRGGVQY